MIGSLMVAEWKRGGNVSLELTGGHLCICRLVDLGGKELWADTLGDGECKATYIFKSQEMSVSLRCCLATSR